LVNRVGFQKGDDPNRSKGGRPKRSILGGKTLPNMAREHTEQALKFLVKTMNNDQADVAVRVRCAETILNRGWGMARQSVDVSKTVEHQHQVTFDASGLDLEVRKKILAMLADQSNVIDVPVTEIPEPELIEHKTGDEPGQGDDAQ
jgi:hypothetical protein